MRLDPAVEAAHPPIEDRAATLALTKSLTGGLWTDTDVASRAAHSGSESNDLFLNVEGAAYADPGYLSGFESRADGRVVVRWDPDGDGFTDLAVVNANAPFLQLFRNRLGASSRRGAVSVRLRGDGHQSNRDAVGARVRARVGERWMMRELGLGEGMASQSSAALLFGVGEASGLDEVVVSWPGGGESRAGPVAAGQEISFVQGQEGSFLRATATPLTLVSGPPTPLPPMLAQGLPAGPILLTSFASWCGACVEEAPELAALASAIPGLTVLGVAVDAEDPAEARAAWIATHQPPWVAFPGDAAAWRRFLSESLGYEAVPTTLLLDAEHRVRLVHGGAPTLSAARRALHGRPSGPR